MKLLFLLPDFFFRNSFYEYRWIAEAICDGLSNENFQEFGCEAKIYGGGELKKIVVEDNIDAESYFVEMSELGILNQKKAFAPSNWCICEAEKIWEWSTDYDLKSLYSRRQAILLNSIYTKFSFTHVIHWGNNIPVASWCLEHNIKHYFVEMGFMRSPSIESLIIDSSGVNSLSSIAKSEEKDFSLRCDFDIQILQESVFESHDKDYSAHCRSDLCFDSPNAFEAYRGLSVITQEEFNTKDNLASQKIGIFLQLADDTQIIGGSGFRSMYEYLNFVIPQIRENHGHDSEIYVRFHPGAVSPSSRPLNAIDAHNCQQLIDSLPNVYQLDIQQNWHDQIQYFRSIYTINSSLAFESWLFLPSLDIILSGIPGWYPSAYLYQSFTLPDGKVNKFCYLLNHQTLKGVALYSLGGYLYRWNKSGVSFINCILHRILCESFALSAPNLRFGMPGPGTTDVLPRASITSYSLIHHLFNQNFPHSSLASNKLDILEFLAQQSFRFFNDIYFWSDSSSLPFAISYIREKSCLVLSVKKAASLHVLDGVKSLTFFVASSNKRIICKRMIKFSSLPSNKIEMKIPDAHLDLCETQYFYVYAFLNPLYDSSSERYSFKYLVNGI